MDVVPSLLGWLFLAGLALVVLGWLAGPVLWRGWRRARVRSQPFPADWRGILRRRMPAFARLPADVQAQVRRQAQVLLAEVPFIGCAGLQVTDEMRVLVAAQAALLRLHPRGAAFGPGFGGLRQVLLYPGAFVVNRVQQGPAGLAQDTRQVLAGESWQQGQVVLSWATVLAGAADPHDGHNVVIHEFAHQLDQATGAANGAPWLGGGRRHAARRARWAAVMGSAFAQLQQRLAAGEPGLIDPYGATDPAEFFAVTSELFFERPAELAAQHPAVYAELSQLYHAHPLQWAEATATLRPVAALC